jgi:hypothetical protein
MAGTAWRWAAGIGGVAAVLALAACGGEEEGQATGAPATDAKATARDPADAFLAGITAYNEANVKGVRESFAPSAAWWNPTRAAAPARGIKSIVKALAAFKAFIPDSRIGVRRVLRRGNSVVAQAVVTGTKRWTDHGTEDEPKRIGFDIAYFVLADDLGRARETIVYFDAAVAQRQTGAMRGEARPVPKQPSGKPEVVGAPGDKAAIAKAEAALAALANGGAGLDALATSDFAYVDTTAGKRIPLAELPAHLAAQAPRIDGLAYKPQQSIAAGQFVAMRWEARGTYAGDGGAAPAEIVLHGASVFTLADGLVKEIEVYASSLERFEKAGLLAGQVAGETDALGPRGEVPPEPAPGKDAGAPAPAKAPEPAAAP